MSALFSFFLGAMILLAAGVDWPIVCAACVLVLILWSLLSAWETWTDYQRKKRRNYNAFVREVVRQHQRANEARKATERS